MEGIGFLSASDPSSDPRWIIVKGISDFADGPPNSSGDDHRPKACYNSARFVLATLKREASDVESR